MLGILTVKTVLKSKTAHEWAVGNIDGENKLNAAQ
jgi:hypothetical protein